MASSSSSFWQQAWEDSQPRLHAIRSSLDHAPPVQSRVLRVGQLDAEQLDQELVTLLTEPLSKALGLIQYHYRTQFEPEMTLIVRLVLYKLSIWDQGASYGAKLQDLRYRSSRVRRIGTAMAPSGIPRVTLYMHAFLTVLIPYIHTKIRNLALTRAWPDAPSSDRRRKAWEFLTRLESAHSVLGLFGFISFLYNGRYRTIADRLLGLRLVPARILTSRSVSYEFMNRQMVWHAFTEFLLFLLPLVNARVLRRRLVRLFTLSQLSSYIPSSIRSIFGSPSPQDPDTKGKAVEKHGKYWSLPEESCAICAENATLQFNSAARSGALVSLAHNDPDMPAHPIYTPYITSCGHTYCYMCLSERMLRAQDEGEPGWECLRCAKIVASCTRYEDPLENGSFTTTDDEDDDSDLGTMGTSLTSDDFPSSTSSRSIS
ncbi:hypothetical protein BOTBODRAFT_100564 [Botryobasidium botryosum FD-172 SS1]|uniref:RING-type E3 ubiquitin transferase (cysteine targeting) n=1 Tax=Botryobasidium botryosum (strain FD-172 SS1) TaxID=930990 RepID=A0A067N0M4_BOTB1|nr:hypothetical protein BOTBODRAFT_100564 [Botryobasidium botryosum FD-172 SS1]